MSKYGSIPSQHREITRYDVAMSGADSAATATVKQVVLSVKDEFYTVEEEIPSRAPDRVTLSIFADAEREAAHRLLTELKRFVHYSHAEVGYCRYQITAKIHLPYIRDEIYADLEKEVAMAEHSSQTSMALVSEVNSRNVELLGKLGKLGKLESLWFVRLYNWLAK